MSASGLKKVPGHVGKATDLGLWKLFLSYTSAGEAVRIQVIKCPMAYRCKCKAKLRITEGSCHDGGYLVLEKSGCHDITSN
jgi:hypothetical protein